MRRKNTENTNANTATSLMKQLAKLQVKHFRLNSKCQAILKDIETTKAKLVEAVNKGEF